MPSSIDKRVGWLGAITICTFLGCAQSELLDLQGNDAGTTHAIGSGGAAPDASDLEPGAGGTGATGGTTGSGGMSLPGTGGAGSVGSGGPIGSGGMTGGTNGGELGGRTGGAGTGTGAGGASSARGGAAGSGQSGAGGGAGHGQGGAGGRVSGTGGSGGTTTTFTTIFTKILAVYCTGSSCHNPGISGGLSFATQASAYAAVSSQVIPGNGAGSDLYSTLQSGAMPKGRAKLSATNLALIKAWIDAGALDD